MAAPWNEVKSWILPLFPSHVKKKHKISNEPDTSSLVQYFQSQLAVFFHDASSNSDSSRISYGINIASFSHHNIYKYFKMIEREKGVPCILSLTDVSNISDVKCKLSALTYLFSLHIFDRAASNNALGYVLQMNSYNLDDTVNVIEPVSSNCVSCYNEVNCISRIIIDDHLWHKSCFLCHTCRIQLRQGTYRLVQLPSTYECLSHQNTRILENILSQENDTKSIESKDKVETETCNVERISLETNTTAEGVPEEATPVNPSDGANNQSPYASPSFPSQRPETGVVESEPFKGKGHDPLYPKLSSVLNDASLMEITPTNHPTPITPPCSPQPMIDYVFLPSPTSPIDSPHSTQIMSSSPTDGTDDSTQPGSCPVKDPQPMDPVSTVDTEIEAPVPTVDIETEAPVPVVDTESETTEPKASLPVVDTETEAPVSAVDTEPEAPVSAVDTEPEAPVSAVDTEPEAPVSAVDTEPKGLPTNPSPTVDSLPVPPPRRRRGHSRNSSASRCSTVSAPHTPIPNKPTPAPRFSKLIATVQYPDDMNPFESDEDSDYDDSLNPFAEDSGRSSYASSLNPFADDSDSDDSSSVDHIRAPARPPPPAISAKPGIKDRSVLRSNDERVHSRSPIPRHKHKAPPPPPPPVKVVKKKRPAPPPPLPFKRKIVMDEEETKLTLDEVVTSLAEIDQIWKVVVASAHLLQQPFIQSVENGQVTEQQLFEWYNIVAKRCGLLEKEAQMVHIWREMILNDFHSEVEFQLRCIIEKPEHEKKESDSLREACLLKLLLGVIEEKSTLASFQSESNRDNTHSNSNPKNEKKKKKIKMRLKKIKKVIKGEKAKGSLE